MRTRWIGLTLAALSLLLASSAMATAQTPLMDNYLRASQHFAGSRYSYRTLSSFVPGSGSMRAAPFVYQNQFIEPGFSRQRIMPYGYDRFDVVPGHGGTTMTPFGFSAYYVPGYRYGYYVPFGR